MARLGKHVTEALKRLLAALGYGTAKLTLHLNEGTHPRGAYVTGRVTVEGGIVEQRIESLKVILIEFAQKGKRAGTQERKEIVIDSGVTIAPRKERDFEFSVFLPDDARLSKSGLFGQALNGCRLDARANIAWSKDPTVYQTLNVVRQREITAVQSAVQQLGFYRTSKLFHLSEPPENTSVQDFLPPDSLCDQLHGMVLHLRAEEDCIQGKVVLNRTEKSLADHLKALIGGNREERPLLIPRADLLTAEGAPNPDGALPHLKQIFNESLILPDNESYRLLRASVAPISEAEYLLRPAGSGGAENAEQLLRPVISPAQGDSTTDH